MLEHPVKATKQATGKTDAVGKEYFFANMIRFFMSLTASKTPLCIIACYDELSRKVILEGVQEFKELQEFSSPRHTMLGSSVCAVRKAAFSCNFVVSPTLNS